MIAPSQGKVQPARIRFLDDAASGLTAFARDTFAELYAQLTELAARIERVTHRVERVYQAHPVCQKLAAVPGIGALTATALLATVGRPQAFRNGRHLAAWLGLVPRQYSSGGKERLGGMSKRGSRYVRTLLIHGVRAHTPQRHPCGRGRLSQQQCRVIWALLAHDEAYRQPAWVQDGSRRSSGGEETRAASHQEDSHQRVPRG